MEQEQIEEGKTAAIIAYITFVGLIIAYFMNSDLKNPFANFHLKQSLGLTLSYFLIMIPLSGLNNPYASGGFFLVFFVLWIYGLVSAANGTLKPVPLLGNLYQRIFTKN